MRGGTTMNPADVTTLCMLLGIALYLCSDPWGRR
jgi:hypothetical protein